MGTKRNSRKNVAATAAASMNTGTGVPKVRKVMHAKAEKPAASATAATTGKKIGKSAAAKKGAAKAKPAKTARKPRGEGGTRTSYAGKAIKVLNKEPGLREGSGRAARFAAVAAAKNTDDVLGKKYKGGGDDVITGSNIAFMVAQGWISIS